MSDCQGVLVNSDIDDFDFFSLWQLCVMGNQLKEKWYSWFAGRTLTEVDEQFLRQELDHVRQMLGYDSMYLEEMESKWYEELDTLVEKRLALLQVMAEQGLHISGIAGGHFTIWEGMTAELCTNYVVITYQSKKFVFGSVHDINGSGSYAVRIMQNLCRLEYLGLECGSVDSFKQAAVEMGAQFSKPQGYRRSEEHGHGCYVCSITDVVPFVKSEISDEEVGMLRDELEETSVEEVRHYAVQGDYTYGQLAMLDLIQSGVCVCPLFSPIAIVDFCKQQSFSSSNLQEIYDQMDDLTGFFSFLVGEIDHECAGDFCWSCFCRDKDHLGTVLECYRKLVPYDLNDDYWKLSSWFSHNRLAYQCSLERQQYMVGTQRFWKKTRQPVFPNQKRLQFDGEFSDSGFFDSVYSTRDCVFIMQHFPLTYQQFLDNKIGIMDDIIVYCCRQMYERGVVFVVFSRQGKRMCKRFRLLFGNLLHGDAVYNFRAAYDDDDRMVGSVDRMMANLQMPPLIDLGNRSGLHLRCNDCGAVACICIAVDAGFGTWGEVADHLYSDRNEEEVTDIIQNPEESDDGLCPECRREFCMCSEAEDEGAVDGASISILRHGVRMSDACLWCGQGSCVCDRCDDCGRYSCVCHIIEENVDNWCDECCNFGEECVCSDLCDGCTNSRSECSCVQ